MGLLDDEVWQAFKRFDDASKRFIGQCYFEELQKNGKDFKGVCKTQTNSNFEHTLREQGNV